MVAQCDKVSRTFADVVMYCPYQIWTHLQSMWLHNHSNLASYLISYEAHRHVQHKRQLCDNAITTYTYITIEACVAGYGRHYRLLVLYTSRVNLFLTKRFDHTTVVFFSGNYLCFTPAE